MNKQDYLCLIGILLLVLSIFQAIVMKQAHFFSVFSIGLFIIILFSYNNITGKNLFKKWNYKNYILFFGGMLIISVVIDFIGLYLGYWDYPNYNTLLDEILKYTLEWTLSLIGYMVAMILFFQIFKKKGKIIALILSLLAIVILGVFTEFLNHQMNSWRVLSMPFSNAKIGEYFIVFQTIGYWLMAIIPYLVYQFTMHIKIKREGGKK